MNFGDVAGAAAQPGGHYCAGGLVTDGDGEIREVPAPLPRHPARSRKPNKQRAAKQTDPAGIMGASELLPSASAAAAARQLRRHAQPMQTAADSVRPDTSSAAPSGAAPLQHAAAAAMTMPGKRCKRKVVRLEPAQATSRDDCSGSASLTGEAALDDDDGADASRRSARTKRFRKSGDVDFAQILGRGSRALDLEMSCDTHGSLGSAAAESAPLERRPSISSPQMLPPVPAPAEQLPCAGSTPAPQGKAKAAAARARRGRKLPVAKMAEDGQLAAAGSAECTVLCAKVLTNSDASSGRIILPRIYVEANLSFVIGYRAYSLAATDAQGRSYDFVIKSWANGTEHRRVYVLEQAAPFIKAHGLAAGDAVGVCTNGCGALTMLANTAEVHAATVRPVLGGMAALKAMAVPAAGKVQPLVTGAPAASCTRTLHCTKPDNHPGFCSRSKAAAADARHARDLGLQLPASSATGGTAAAAEARRLMDVERPTPQPPRRPRSERPTKPTLKIRAQQEAHADSLAAEVLMSLLGSSDSFATSDDHVADGGRPAVNSRPTTPLQPLQPAEGQQQPEEEKPPLAATRLTAAPAATMPTWLPVRQPPPQHSGSSHAAQRPAASQCITTGFSPRLAVQLPALPSFGLAACRSGQPLPLFMPPAQMLQTPLSL